MSEQDRQKRGQPRSIPGSLLKSLMSFVQMLPILIGIFLLLGLFKTFVTRQMLASVFSGTGWIDVLIGASIGSISAGNTMTSYIVGGELLSAKVSLLAVTAFIVAWVTVGVVQLPMEAATLGRRFALVRNLVSYLLAIAVAAATVVTLGVFT